jgi:ABC-type enterochelin transport system permease subunit
MTRKPRNRGTGDQHCAPSRVLTHARKMIRRVPHLIAVILAGLTLAACACISDVASFDRYQHAQPQRAAEPSAASGCRAQRDVGRRKR